MNRKYSFLSAILSSLFSSIYIIGQGQSIEYNESNLYIQRIYNYIDSHEPDSAVLLINKLPPTINTTLNKSGENNLDLFYFHCYKLCRIKDNITSLKLIDSFFNIQSNLNTTHRNFLARMYKVKSDNFFFLNDKVNQNLYLRKTLDIYLIDTSNIDQILNMTNFLSAFINSDSDIIHKVYWAISLAEKKSHTKSKNYINLLNTLGFHKLKNKEYDSSIYYYNISENIMNSQRPRYDAKLAPAIINKGACYLAKFDNENAVLSFKKGISILKSINQDKTRNAAMAYYNLGIIYGKQDLIQESIEYYDIAIRILNHINKNDIQDEIYSEMAKTLIRANQYEKALEIAHNYYTTSLNHKKDSTISLFFYSRLLSEIYFNLNNLDSSFFWANKTNEIKLPSKQSHISHKITSNIYALKSLAEKKKFAEAEIYLNNAKNLLDKINVEKNINEYILNKCFYLYNVALFHYYKYKNEYRVEELVTAKELALNYITTLKEYRNNISLTSKEKHSFNYRYEYEKIIEILMELNNLKPSEEEFYNIVNTFESFKSIRLLENQQELKQLQGLNIPDSLVQRMNKLQVSITRTEDLIANSKNKPLENSSVNELHEQLYQLNSDRELLVKQLSIYNPNIFKLNNNSTPAYTQLIKSELSEDQAILTFFYGKEKIYAVLVTKNKNYIHETKFDSLILNKIQSIREFIKNPKSIESTITSIDQIQNFIKNSRYFYDQIILPFQSILTENVIIIPDGVFSYLPFELLLEQTPKNPYRFDQYGYFFKKYNISYSPSIAMYIEMKNKSLNSKTMSPINFVGFAPVYNSDTSEIELYADLSSLTLRYNLFSPLPFAKQEVNEINTLFNGVKYIDHSATKEKFIENMSQAKILHIAGHAQSNDESGDFCFIAFNNKKGDRLKSLLFARELYNLPCKAQLVTLSACQTGVGQMKEAEGIISLARGFAISGANSILTGMWQVSDISTKELMIDFYSHIKSGLSKTQSLRQAKLNYLKNHKSEASHPFYWAGFILIGDPNPIR